MTENGLWIPPEIKNDNRLNCTEKFLLAEIFNLQQVGECFASNNYFSELLGIHEKHVSRVIRRLVEFELVSLEFTYKKGTKAIEKRIIRPSNKNVTTLVTNCYDPSNKNVTTPSNINVTDKEHVFKEQDKKQINNKTYVSEFEILWELYPKKEGKKKAFESYKKARKEKVEYETILFGLKRYCKYVQIQQIDRQYIKHGSTWFNGQHWLDEHDLQPKQRQNGKRVSAFERFNQNEQIQFEDVFESDERRSRKAINDYIDMLP